MRLDQFQAVAKKRGEWKVLDLGLVFARKWYWKLVSLWLIQSLPIFLLATFLLGEHAAYVALVVWWFKPLFERALLFFTSRQLFGQRLSVLETLTQFKQFVVPDILMPLTIRRLAPTRSYNMPIAVLENLSGKARSKRADLINRRFSNSALWSLVTCVHIELFLMFGIAAGMFFFIPESVEIDWEHWFIDQELLLTHMYNVIWYIAATLVAPIYVCSGFALYIQRRIDLEAWDIEILFRKLKHRREPKPHRSGLKALLLVLGVGMFSVPDSLQASEDVLSDRELSHEHQQINATVVSIYGDEDFSNIEQRSGFRKIEEEKTEEIPEGIIKFVEWLEANGDFFSGVAKVLEWVAVSIEVILWVLLACILAFVLFHFRKQIKALSGRMFASPIQNEVEAPKVLFGLDVTEESLPDNVVDKAMDEWNSGARRAAMALLLRASIVELMQKDGCRFFDGNTEAECADIVNRSLDKNAKARVFALLVSHWQTIAYAHRDIEQFSFSEFCRQWEGEFDVA